MNFLSPQIAQMSKKKPKKSLARKGVSCGIFQDIGDQTSQKIHQQKKYNK